MLAGGPLGACGASAYVGWSLGRLIGSNVGWGGETIDQKTTRSFDNVMNSGVNQQAAEIQKHNLELAEKQKTVIGQDLNQIKAAGKTSKDLSEAIIGLRESQEKARESGNTAEAESMQKETARLIQMRSQLAAQEAQKSS